MSDIVISGYLGYKNSGDEALLWVLLKSIRENFPDKSITVLSAKPAETASHYGVRAIGRFNAPAILLEFMRSDTLIFGGGSLLQDLTSRRSLYYYLWILNTADRCGMKTIMYANGIGPLLRESSRRMTAKAIRHVDALTLRDEKSLLLLREIGAARPDAIVTADPAFLLTKYTAPKTGRLPYSFGVKPGEPYVVVSIRTQRGISSRLEHELPFMCDYIFERYGLKTLFVPMQYDKDISIIRRVASRMKHSAAIWDCPFTAGDVASVLGGAVFTISMRLHMLIYAATLGVPSVAISCDTKIDALMDEAGQPFVIPAGEFTLDAATPVLDRLMSYRDEYSQALLHFSSVMAHRAEMNTAALGRILG